MHWNRGAAGLAAAALFVAQPAGAEIVETASITNGYGYFFDTGTVTPNDGGSRVKMFVPSPDNAAPSELGIDYVGEVTDGSFYFLHNNYCVGLCSTGSQTIINFVVTNTGTTDQALRFDSLITPGHLARLGTDPSARAGFSFDVTQQTGLNEAETIYSASGSVTGDVISVVTSDNRDFTGLRQFSGFGGTVLDWSATNLNLQLGTLAAGETTVIRYIATYYSTAFGNSTDGGSCTDLPTCTAAQVVFGDPRNNGSGLNANRMMAFAQDVDPIEEARNIINRRYGAYEIPFAFVDAASPLPDEPEPLPDLNYGGTFSPIASVPEPTTWAMMLVGAGLVGWRLRRRRAGCPVTV